MSPQGNFTFLPLGFSHFSLRGFFTFVPGGLSHFSSGRFHIFPLGGFHISSWEVFIFLPWGFHISTHGFLTFLPGRFSHFYPGGFQILIWGFSHFSLDVSHFSPEFFIFLPGGFIFLPRGLHISPWRIFKFLPRGFYISPRGFHISPWGFHILPRGFFIFLPGGFPHSLRVFTFLPRGFEGSPLWSSWFLRIRSCHECWYIANKAICEVTSHLQIALWSNYGTHCDDCFWDVDLIPAIAIFPVLQALLQKNNTELGGAVTYSIFCTLTQINKHCAPHTLCCQYTNSWGQLTLLKYFWLHLRVKGVILWLSKVEIYLTIKRLQCTFDHHPKSVNYLQTSKSGNAPFVA